MQVHYGLDLATFSHVIHSNYPVGFHGDICKLRYCEGNSRQGGRIWLFFSPSFFSTLYHENLRRMRK